MINGNENDACIFSSRFWGKMTLTNCVAIVSYIGSESTVDPHIPPPWGSNREDSSQRKATLEGVFAPS